MANYFIIGGDGKEYGPVTEADVQQWLAEARLNAQTSARRDSDTAWQPLGTFPEFAAAFNVPPPIEPAAAAGFSSGAAPADTDYQERDYELDIGGCITGGWEVMKSNFGTLFGAFLIVVALTGISVGVVDGLLHLALPEDLFKSGIVRQVLTLLDSVLLALVLGPLLAGFYNLVIRANRNELVSVGDVFAGFQNRFKEIFLGYLIMTLVVGVCMLPYNLVNEARLLPITEQMRHASPAEVQALMPQMSAAFFSTLPVLFLCMIPVTYLTVNWQFTLPLIMDKQLPFGAAMKTSWKLVHRHWWQVFGLTIVVGLVSMAGLLACCIGVVFTFPVGMAAGMIAYETIFGARKN